MHTPGLTTVPATAPVLIEFAIINSAILQIAF
jgi:hypothetical protein